MSSTSDQEVGHRFKEEVQRTGGPSRVADALGVSRSTVYNWFNNGQISIAQLADLNRALGLDGVYVLFGAHPVSGKHGVVGNRTGHVSAAGGVVGGATEALAPINIDDYQWVPLYDVEVSGGDGRLVYGEQVKELNPYRKNYLAKRGLQGASLIEVTVVGDSMADELRDGDTVLVDTGDTQIKGGAIYVVRIGDDLLVKYLQQLPGGSIQVSSENARAFPPYEVSAESIDHDLVVVGRVRHQGRDR